MDASLELRSRAVARNPLTDSKLLHAVSMVGHVPEHLGRGPSGVGSAVSKNPLSDTISLNAESIVGYVPERLGRGPSDVVSVVENPLSGSRPNDEDPLHAECMVGRGPGYQGRGPADTSAVAYNPRSGYRLVDEDPLGTGVGTVGCKPRHIECDSDNAGVVAHEPLDADCRNSSASSDVVMTPRLGLSKLRCSYLVKPQAPVQDALPQ